MCTGGQKLIRISSLDKSHSFQFTHLELQFNLSTVALLAEYPKFGESSDMSLLDKLSEVQINLTNKVVSLHPEDIISDSSVSRLWRVSAAQIYRDHSQNVIGWDCNASVVQQYEIQNSLPKRIGQKSRHQKHNSSIRQTIKP
jgi:replicative superfamily II helicase